MRFAKPRCGDCAVEVGQRHEDGCDVARCLACGWQRIGCDCPEDAGWGQVWDGRWPGEIECAEYGWTREGDPAVPGIWPDLNRLATCAAQGLMIWNGTRWILAERARTFPGLIEPKVLLPHRIVEAMGRPYGADGTKVEGGWHYLCICGLVENELASLDAAEKAFRVHAGWTN